MTDINSEKDNLVSDETRKEISDFFKTYARAFSEYDLKKISSLWALPCIVISNEVSVSFSTAAEYEENLEKLCKFYRSVSMAEANKIVLDVSYLTSTTVSARTQDTAFNSDGEAIVSWQQAYVLQRFESGWKAMMTVADGEVTTWAAKDTPLAAKPATSDNVYLD